MRVAAVTSLCWDHCFGSMSTPDLVVPLDYGLRFGALTTCVGIHGISFPLTEAVIELRFDVEPDQSQRDEDFTQYVDLCFTGHISSNSSETRQNCVRYPRDVFVASRRFFRSADIDVTPGSIFATTVREMILIPPTQGDNRGSLVMHPRNYHEFCFEGEMGFSILSDRLELMVEVGWINRLDNTTSLSFSPVPFKFSPNRATDLLPEYAMDAFIDTFLPRALRSNDTFETLRGFSESGETLIRFDCVSDESVFGRLPVLEYRIMRSDRQLEPATVINYHPRDYVTVMDDEISCMTRFESSGGPRGSFGILTFSTSVIYFDNVQRIVGFGEPI